MQPTETFEVQILKPLNILFYYYFYGFSSYYDRHYRRNLVGMCTPGRLKFECFARSLEASTKNKRCILFQG